LNTVDNCNTVVSIIMLWDHRCICDRRWPKRRYSVHDCTV